MSKHLWAKKLAIPATVAGVAMVTLGWQIHAAPEDAALAMPAVSGSESSKVPACCVSPAEALESTKLLETQGQVSTQAGPTASPTTGKRTEKAAPVDGASTYARDRRADATKPRFRYLGQLVQAGPGTSGGSLSLQPAGGKAAASVDDLLDGVGLPEYQGASKVFDKVAPTLKENAAQETSSNGYTLVNEEDMPEIVPNPLFPELTAPLATVEDYKARLEVVEEVGRTVAATAERINNTAGQWKLAYDRLKERSDVQAKQIEELKEKNRELLIEKGNLSRKSNTSRVYDMKAPLLNITEKDLGLPARPDVAARAPAPAPAPAPAAAPRTVRSANGTVYEAPRAPEPRPSRSPASVPVVKNPAAAPARGTAPTLNNLPTPFPASQPGGAPSASTYVPPTSASPDELAAYHRWKRENDSGRQPNNAAASKRQPAPAAGEKNWEWDPTTGSIRRVER